MTIVRQSCLAAVFALPILLFFTNCAVGPNFKRPDSPKVAGYIPTPLTNTASVPNVVGGDAQSFSTNMDIPAQWWTLFHSQPLNDLIERALTNNPNIKSAQAALLVAQENMKAQVGGFWPSIAASFSGSRQRQSELIAPVPNASLFTYNLFTPEVAVSYTPDVFGLNRRTVETLKAQSEQQRFTVLATDIALTANVVTAAINEASLRGQIAATTNLIEETTKALDILRSQFSKGYASRLDLAAQESQLAGVVATLPPLLKQLAQQRDALTALVGAFPIDDPIEKFELTSLQLPQELPLTVPSKLVAQRPDIRQAEENMHSASAQIGVAVANRIPNITLSANAGSTALTFDKLFSSGTAFWTVGGTVTQPVFDGGTLLHKQRSAQAAFTQAAEQYRAAVITAFQNVADTLNALETDSDALKAASEAEHAARVTLDLTRHQLQAGYTSYLTLITAEAAYQQAMLNLVQAQANRFSDTAALFLALGGGWWNRPNAQL